MLKLAIGAGATLLTLAAPAFSQVTALPEACGVEAAAPAEMDHEAMDHGAMDHGDAATGHAAMMGDMDAMNTQMMAAMTLEDPDLAFICGMIPHHQGAIVMAEAVLETTDDEFVRALAEDIIAAQNAEIAAMTDWLEARP